MEAEHCLILQVYYDVARVDVWSFRGQLLGVIQEECSGARIVSEAGRQGVGQEKLERANSAGELQQSLHKRGGLCNACGFRVGELGPG